MQMYEIILFENILIEKIISGHHRGASDRQLPLAQDGGQPLPRAQQLPERKQPTEAEG